MNVPFIKEKAIQIDMAVDKIKEDVKTVLKTWDEKADEIFEGFLNLFHRDAPLRTNVRKARGELLNELKSFFGSRTTSPTKGETIEDDSGTDK
jgi:hypothetical protein